MQVAERQVSGAGNSGSGLQQGMGSRRTDTDREPANPRDFPCRLRHGGKYHRKEAQSQGDDAPYGTARHNTVVLSRWLISGLTAFTSGYVMVLSPWQPNGAPQLRPKAVA
jgi:hypothetical protein